MIKHLPYYNALLFALALALILLGHRLPDTQGLALLSVLGFGAAFNLLALAGTALSRPEIEDIAVLYVYGFTDDSGTVNSERLHSFNDYYVRNLDHYNKEIVITFDDYVWDSEEVRLFGIKLAGHWKVLQYSQSKESWELAKENALREGKKLYLSKIKKFEKRGQPYYIIGYSLGTQVVLEALNHARGELKMLRGVFLLGSAMPFDYQANSGALKKGQPILNYYSGKDGTLGRFYKSAEEIEAGGYAGFKDTKAFLNLETFYDHDEYNEHIYPVCNLILYLEDAISLVGEYRRCRAGETASEGWHSLYAFPSGKGEEKDLYLQYKNDRYRAVDIHDKSLCLAESDNLHLLLKNLLG